MLYAAWAEAGFVKESDLLNLRKIDCDLEGHPTPVSSGALVKAEYYAAESYLIFFVFAPPPHVLPPETGVC